MRLGDIPVGEVWFFENRSMQPRPKPKFNLFIGKARFFVISSDPDHYCNLKILKSDYPSFLDHDSYIGCSKPFTDSENRIIPDSAKCGSLSKETLTQLIERVKLSLLLTDYQIQEIASALQLNIDTLH